MFLFQVYGSRGSSQRDLVRGPLDEGKAAELSVELQKGGLGKLEEARQQLWEHTPERHPQTGKLCRANLNPPADALSAESEEITWDNAVSYANQWLAGAAGFFPEAEKQNALAAAALTYYFYIPDVATYLLNSSLDSMQENKAGFTGANLALYVEKSRDFRILDKAGGQPLSTTDATAPVQKYCSLVRKESGPRKGSPALSSGPASPPLQAEPEPAKASPPKVRLSGSQAQAVQEITNGTELIDFEADIAPSSYDCAELKRRYQQTLAEIIQQLESDDPEVGGWKGRKPKTQEEIRELVAAICQVLHTKFSIPDISEVPLFVMAVATGELDCDTSCVPVHDALAHFGVSSEFVILVQHLILKAGSEYYETRSGSEGLANLEYYPEEEVRKDCFVFYGFFPTFTLPAYVTRATIESVNGLHWKAIADLDRVESLYPDNSYLCISKAIVYAQAGKHRTALAWADKSLEIYPDNPHTYYKKAQILELSGRFKAAAAELSKGLAIYEQAMAEQRLGESFPKGYNEMRAFRAGLLRKAGETALDE